MQVKSKTTHLAHPKYRPDIDGLRAIAVLAVVGFHAFPHWVKGGFIGVDIFFVISGFLISTILFESLEKGTFSFTEFYARRIRRIFPALLIVLVSCFAFGWFALLADEYKQLGKHIAGGAGFISNFLLWDESGYFDNDAETKPLLHLWSLGIEEQFYIVWPLLLWVAWKKQFNLLAITLVIAIISFILNVKGVRADSIATFYSPQTRFWELLCGSLLAWLTLYKTEALADFNGKLNDWLNKVVYRQAPEANGSTLPNILAIVGALLIGYALYRLTKESRFPGTWALLPTLGAVLIISAGKQAWINRVILSNRVLVWFGLISFPLYLWHWPLLSFARILESETPTETVRITAVLISTVLAWLTYKLIEKPIRFGEPIKGKTISSAVLMIIVGYAGYSTYQRDGLESRFPRILQELTQYKYDYKNDYREGSCFLEAKRDFANFTNFDTCKSANDKNKETIILWGDSYAAHLYPGYKAVYGDTINLVQRTSNACPPILNFEHPGRAFCRNLNDVVFEEIKETKGVRVVLAANWVDYDWKKVQKIQETIAQLKRLGVTNIDLVGPVPQWKDGLPKQLYQYFKKDAFHKIPYQMSFGLDEIFMKLDPLLLDYAIKQNINYISPRSILCSGSECLTRLGETGETLIAWDRGHLTKMGSEFLVSKFPKH